jgi:hypothetical protein
MNVKPPMPPYRLHEKSGQAVVTLTDRYTRREEDILLGIYDSEESRVEYQRVVLAWEVRGYILRSQDSTSDITIAELVTRYWDFVQGYYRHPDGTPTGEVHSMTYSLRPIDYLFGKMRVRDFGPAD